MKPFLVPSPPEGKRQVEFQCHSIASPPPFPLKEKHKMQIHRIILDGRLDVHMDGLQPRDEEEIDETIRLIEQTTYRGRDVISFSLMTAVICVILQLLFVDFLTNGWSDPIYFQFKGLNLYVGIIIFSIAGLISFHFLRKHAIVQNEKNIIRLHELVHASVPCRDLVTESKKHSQFIDKNFDRILADDYPH